jgi:hypothetical protein
MYSRQSRNPETNSCNSPSGSGSWLPKFVAIVHGIEYSQQLAKSGKATTRDTIRAQTRVYTCPCYCAHIQAAELKLSFCYILCLTAYRGSLCPIPRNRREKTDIRAFVQRCPVPTRKSCPVSYQADPVYSRLLCPRLFPSQSASVQQCLTLP